MIHVNANAVQRCHEGTLRLIESELQHYQQRAATLQLWSVSERLALESEVWNSLEKLDATMQYDALNYEGFRKILKKFDKRTGCVVSSSVLADLQRHGFFLDSSALGNGRCAALRIGLSSLLRILRIPHLSRCLYSGMRPETCAAAASTDADAAAGGGAARGA
jgi:SPX domain protein involved in polyphosphate accumulation